MENETGEPRADFGIKPKTQEELLAWLKEHLGLKMPTKPLCEGHQSPFEYLWGAYDEPAKDVVVWAPRGGGKTKLGAVATLLDLIYKPGCSVRILGGSLAQSMKMWEHLINDLELIGSEKFACKTRVDRIRAANGSIAAILSQSQKAVRGIRVQKLRCDEVELFDPKVWEAAQMTTRSKIGEDGATGVIEVFSTLHRPWGMMQKIVDQANERGTRVIKWCLLDVLEKCPPERDCDTCLLLDDCQRRAKDKCDGFFSIDDAIAIKRRVSRETWEAEMLCQRPSVTRVVFKTFNPDIHVREEVSLTEEGRELWLGIDFGFRNPFVCLWIRRDHKGTMHVIDEYVQSERRVVEHVREIRARAHGDVTCIACDPAGAAANEQTALSNVQVLRSSGFKVRTRGSQIQEGIEMVRTALQTGTRETQLFIHPNCARLIKAMQAYRYGDDNSEVPLKDGEHDHLIDALRYFFINAKRSKTDSGRY